jgi:hypothetical protein
VVNRISGRTSLSYPRTSGNSSTGPRLGQSETTTLERKVLPESGTVSLAAHRAMAVQSFSDRADDLVSDPATQTSASQHVSLSALDTRS